MAMAEFSEIICCDHNSIGGLKSRIHNTIRFIDTYKWLIDAYVSDFYVYNYWKKILPCWTDLFENLSPPQHSFLLDTNGTELDQEIGQVLPLSLLSFKSCLKNLALKRRAVDLEDKDVQKTIQENIRRKNSSEKCVGRNAPSSSGVIQVSQDNVASSTLINGQDYALYHVFRRHVKPKKQHEIHRLAKGVELLSEVCRCKKIVDVGAGLGHLSRILTFSKGLSVTTVEAAGAHAPKAFNYDKEMERDLMKAMNRIEKQNQNEEASQKNVDSDKITICDKVRPNHVICTISPDISAADFVKILNEQKDCDASRIPFKHPRIHCETLLTENESRVISKSENEFILGGLHACGDLTATLLRVFVSSELTVGLASVGCCYMKLTCRSDKDTHTDQHEHIMEEGYPMSKFVKSLPGHQLSYAAREMACHFADSYSERLKEDKEHLKVHCYRAAFQHILTTLHPEFDRGSMKLTIKNATNMSFENYSKVSLKKLGYSDEIPSEVLKEAEGYLTQWKNVMSFYTVRLSLAPVVESLILLDRLMYLYEHGISSMLVPIFDPSLSPRNFLLLAQK